MLSISRINKSFAYLLLVGVIGALFIYFQLNELLHRMFFFMLVLFGGAVVLFQVKKLEKLFWSLTFLAPISFSMDLMGGISLKTPLELLTLLLIAVFLLKKLFGLNTPKLNWKHPLMLLIFLDLGWTLIASLNSELSSISLKRLLLKTIFILGYFILFNQVVQKEKHKLFSLFGFGAVIPIAIITIRHAGYGFSQNTSFAMSQPFFDDHTQYGAAMAFVLPYFLLHLKRENNRIHFINLFVSIILIIAVLTSYSRAAWISLIAALLFYLLLKFRVKFYPLLIMIAGSAIFFTLNFQNYYNDLRKTEVKYADDVSQHLTSVTNLQNDASNLERINRWVCAYRMFKEKPLTGFGPGTYQFVYDRYQTSEFMTRISTHKGDKGNAHSEVFNSLSEQGLPGAIIFLIILFYSLHLGMKNIYLTTSKTVRKLLLSALLGLITFYVHGMFNTFTDIAEIAFLIYGSLAILYFIDTVEVERKT